MAPAAGLVGRVIGHVELNALVQEPCKDSWKVVLRSEVRGSTANNADSLAKSICVMLTEESRFPSCGYHGGGNCQNQTFERICVELMVIGRSIDACSGRSRIPDERLNAAAGMLISSQPLQDRHPVAARHARQQTSHIDTPASGGSWFLIKG